MSRQDPYRKGILLATSNLKLKKYIQMKKNMLKYCLMLLMAFLFCTKTMSGTVTAPDCGGGGTLTLQQVSAVPGDYQGGIYAFVFGFCFTNNPEVLESCISGGAGCEIYFIEPVPLESGVIVLMLFVLGYGCFLYYRRRQPHKAA